MFQSTFGQTPPPNPPTLSTALRRPCILILAFFYPVFILLQAIQFFSNFTYNIRTTLSFFEAVPLCRSGFNTQKPSLSWHSERAENNVNPLNAELNPIRHLLALVGARHIVHVSRVRVKLLQVLDCLLAVSTVKFCNVPEVVWQSFSRNVVLISKSTTVSWRLDVARTFKVRSD